VQRSRPGATTTRLPLGGHSIISPTYLEMDRGVNNSEIDELTKRGVATIETQFGQEGLDGDSGLTSKIDMEHVRGAGVFQVSEGIISGLPGGCPLTWSFKMLGI